MISLLFQVKKMRFWEFKELASNHRKEVVEPGVPLPPPPPPPCPPHHGFARCTAPKCVAFADALLKFLVISEQGAAHIYFTLDPTNYGLGTES